MAIDYSRASIPNNVDLSERPPRCSARWRTGSRASSTGGRTWAPTALPGLRRLPAHRDLGRRQAAGPTSTT